MALNRTKLWYGEQVLNQLTDSNRNRDEKIDLREIYIQLDNAVNSLAKTNHLENWIKYGNGQVDEGWKTVFGPITITDPINYGPSYFQIPANYVGLRRNEGISEVYFTNDPTAVTQKYYDPIHVISQRDSIVYRNNMAGQLAGRLSVFPLNGNLVFNQPNVGAVFGTVNVSLVIKDSTQILETAPYPVPAEYEDIIIKQTVAYFRERRQQPTDLVRDMNDSNDAKEPRYRTTQTA